MLCNEIEKYCLSKPGAVETYPFGDWPICYKVGGKIFAPPFPVRPSELHIPASLSGAIIAHRYSSPTGILSIWNGSLMKTCL